MAFRALYTSGPRPMVLMFVDEPSYRQWEQEVLDIKRLILDISAMDTNDGEARDYTVWIQAVKRFRARVGDARVPEDIRASFDSMEEGLGLVRSPPWRV